MSDATEAAVQSFVEVASAAIRGLWDGLVQELREEREEADENAFWRDLLDRSRETMLTSVRQLAVWADTLLADLLADDRRDAVVEVIVDVAAQAIATVSPVPDWLELPVYRAILEGLVEWAWGVLDAEGAFGHAEPAVRPAATERRQRRGLRISRQVSALRAAVRARVPRPA